jgi:hypothetical protein
MIIHKKKFGIYHWDTFDNETILVGEADTSVEAIEFVNDKYGDRIRRTGADQVDIVDLKGNILEKFSVG